MAGRPDPQPVRLPGSAPAAGYQTYLVQLREQSSGSQPTTRGAVVSRNLERTGRLIERIQAGLAAAHREQEIACTPEPSAFPLLSLACTPDVARWIETEFADEVEFVIGDDMELRVLSTR